MKILLVDDDELLHDTVGWQLKRDGYDVDSAFDGKAALELAKKNVYDLLILDVRLPGQSGLEVIRQVRENHVEVPAIMISSDVEEATRLDGFRLGADDFVVKPFSLIELSARVKAVLRRRIIPVNDSETLEIGKAVFDFQSLTMRLDGKSEECSRHEILLLKLLSSKPGKVFSRDMLLHFAWGADRFPTDRTVDNYVNRLRKKLELATGKPGSAILESVYGSGYRFNPQKD